MNFRDLEYVLAIAKYGQFSQAAAACNVSQPAMSNQVKKLEQELGAELFLRLNNEVRPTLCGVQVLRIAERILNDAQKIRDTATQFRDPEAVPYTIGMTPTLAPYLTQYFSDLFSALFPKMRVTMIEDLPQNMLRMVEDHTLDLALVAKINNTETLEFTSIWSEPLFLAVREGHPLCTLPSIAPEDVPRHDFIRLPHSFGYELENRLPKIDPVNRASKRFDLTALRFETICRHICYSDDCTIVSALAAEQFKRDRWPLCFIPFDAPGNLRDLGAATRPGCPRRPLLDRIGAFILEQPPVGVTPTFQM
ncbi:MULTISPECIES: LysR substrate-binding domain-containing protein [unclassified Ruegeria]|uniref:LysR family transcriptional regulator n=1 Tax=unclassified Ruegeria TaxID=2625375 RepID=UPI001ADB1B4A|nr:MULTISPECIES: LysR substrate-binding domain-containing protein [unclassified Ruegeria]MBO9412436.1 LysR family transcriptional regulator [Ruegeria sp. R8_1]MBO9416326.1 LysR family transcriptional regulator [Ruegeria sp. R8_2]